MNAWFPFIWKVFKHRAFFVLERAMNNFKEKPKQGKAKGKPKSPISLQTVGGQFGRCLHLAHVFVCSFGDGDYAVQRLAAVIGDVRVLPADTAAFRGPAEGLAVKLDGEEIVFFLAYSEAFVLEIVGKLGVVVDIFVWHFDFSFIV